MIITSYGAVYRISRPNWQRYLKSIAGRSETVLEDFSGKQIGIIDFDVSDISHELAQDYLDYCKG